MTYKETRSRSFVDFMYFSLLQTYTMATLREKLLGVVTEPVATGRNKITVVGVGQVGMACAFSILTKVGSILLFCESFFFVIIKKCLTSKFAIFWLKLLLLHVGNWILIFKKIVKIIFNLYEGYLYEAVEICIEFLLF